MKRIVFHICLLISVLSLLPGCSTNMPKTTRDTIGVTEETTTSDVFDIPNRQDVYFATGNDYYDLYIAYSFVPSPEITLLSREYIDPKNIHVSADIQSDYSVFVTEQETGASLTSYTVIESEGKRNAHVLSMDAYDFPLYLYQTYCGMNWVDVGQKYTNYRDIMDLYDIGKVDRGQVETALNQYNFAATEHITAYTKLVVDDLPRFYEYSIQIIINDVKTEEVLTTVHVTIGNISYDVNIGKVFLRSSSKYSSGSDYLYMKRSSPLWISCYPYGPGIEQCRSEVYYAEQSVTLKGLQFLENTLSTATVLDVVAVIADDEYDIDTGNGIHIEWDGVTPIYVEQGKYVALYILVHDDRMKEINYHSKLYPVLEFEHRNIMYEKISEIPLRRHYSDNWLLYAIGLDNLNMESYFNDFHYLTANEKWRYDVDLTPWGQEE